jgi:hypothetical protein
MCQLLKLEDILHTTFILNYSIKHCCLLMPQGVVEYIIIVILYLHFFFVIKWQ